VPYFHVVFTLPDTVNRLCLYATKNGVWYFVQDRVECIARFWSQSKVPWSQNGMVAILHTWGQNLSLHPHLHCIVPGVALPLMENGSMARTTENTFFPVKAMSKVFRARFVESLRKEFGPTTVILWTNSLLKIGSCMPNAHLQTLKYVVEYLGRYTHKIAISNHRIIFP